MKDLYLFKLVISIPYLFLLSKINFLFFKYGAADQIPIHRGGRNFPIPNWFGLLVRERLRRKLPGQLKKSHWHLMWF